MKNKLVSHFYLPTFHTEIFIIGDPTIRKIGYNNLVQPVNINSAQFKWLGTSVINTLWKIQPWATLMLVSAPSNQVRRLTVILGTAKILVSSVMVPTMTAVFPSCPFILRTSLAMDIGGRLVLDMNRRRITISLNLESVRRAQNLYSWKEQMIKVRGSSDVTGFYLQHFQSSPAFF